MRDEDFNGLDLKNNFSCTEYLKEIAFIDLRPQ
jgi:ABC-type molybdenum transport system ATPase subunit/photorepair protein PhrA